MNPIANPNPVTPGVCDQYWLATLSLSQTTLSAALRPYDAAGRYTLGNASKAHRVGPTTIAGDAAAVAARQALFAAVAAIAVNSSGVRTVNIADADPLEPVSLVAYFVDGESCTVADLYGTAATASPALAAATAQLLSYLASK